MSVDTKLVLELARRASNVGVEAELAVGLREMANEVDRLREENEKLRINEGPLLMAALTEVNEVWKPLIVAAEEVEMYCLDGDGEQKLRRKRLRETIAACKESA